MSVLTEHLTLEQFRAFEQSKIDGPRYEYWEGKAAPKATPTWLHSTLQRILADMFEGSGYYSAVELDFRINPTWQPKPDVTAALVMEQPYPTKPVEIVAEVLAPSDEPAEVLDKCRRYQKDGIGQIYVFDPERRIAKQWDPIEGELKHIVTLKLTNGIVVTVADIWLALDKKLSKKS
jgi:Uma2 family endonuclease